MIDFDADRDPLDMVAEEFADRCRHGEQPTIGEYAEKYPDLAEQLRDLLPPVAKMEQLKRLKQAARHVPLEGTHLRRLGDYRILREIGRGGMGIVYEAVQESLGRHVALKVLPQHAHLEPKRLHRFQREAQAAARLHHTNIVPVFGVGADEGLHYYVMQFIEGQGLNEVLAELRRGGPTRDTPGPTVRLTPPSALPARRADGDPLPVVSAPAVRTGPATDGRWREVAHIGIQAAQALHYAHQQGILHRDIKPANLLRDARGTVWITDFGLAKWTDQKGMTHTGDVVGTLHYMAPECLQGQADARSDVYALGLTLYELLTLQLPFNDAHPAGLIRQVLEDEPRRPRRCNPAIPRDLETIVLKAMARDAEQRYQTAEALAEDLQRFLDDRPIQARRVTSLERGWRWCRRNRALSSLTAAVLVSLLLAATTGWVGYASTARALKGEADKSAEAARALQGEAEKSAEAEAATKRAQANVELSLRQFEEIFNHIAQGDKAATPKRWGDMPFGAPFGAAVSEEDAALLLSILTFYDRFAESNATNPSLQREAAKAHRRVADIYQRLGQLDKADVAYRRATTIYEKLVADFPDHADYRRELAETYTLTGSRSTEALAEVEGRLRRALTLTEELAVGLFDVSDYTPLLARIHGKLGAVLHQRGRQEEAEQEFSRAVELHKMLAEEAGPSSQHAFELALARHAFAAFLLKQERPAEVETLLDESLADWQAHAKGGARPRGYSQRLLAQDFDNLADAWTRMGETTRAKDAKSKAKKLNAKGPPLGNGPPGGRGPRDVKPPAKE